MSDRSQFVHLHLHSEYSLLDGACKTKEIPRRASALGMTSVAITDHGNLHGSIEFYRSCLAEGVKPIIGLEAYVCEHCCREKRDGKANTGHMVLLARNNAGYQNLLKLASRASLEGFYYHPRVDLELLQNYSEGIIALTACLGGEIPKLIREEQMDKVRSLCGMYQDLYGKDGFYLELQDHNTPEKLLYPDQPKINAALRELSKELNIPLVASNDVHFMNKDDYDAHEVLICIGTQTTLDEHRNKNLSYSTEHYLKSPEEMYSWFPDDREALENTLQIADLCDVSIELDNPQLPEYEVPEGHTRDSMLREICEVKLAEVYQNEEALRQQATERLDYELQVISEKGLSAYFLIVRDFLKWSREQGILVGIRGSGAGAIVSYLTGISTLDPLTYKLWFERFLSPDRTSMPDIDCDFEDRRRGEVIEYVVQKYGVDHVAQVATFGTLKPRLAVRDAARAMGIPLYTADKLSKALGPAKSIEIAIEENPQIKEWYGEDPTIRSLLEMASKLQGLSRHVGTHAAAVVITRDPLVEIAPLQRTSDGLGVQTQWEMNNVTAAGLVKMDFLGLRTLTVLKDTLNYVEKNHGVSYDLTTLPLDDAKAYELMARGDTAGVFQLESVGMRNALRQLKPDRITDIIAMVALYRPGPMAEIPKFCQGKHDPNKITYLHPSLEPILKETYGVLVYQEQVMAIGREVAGLDMVDSNNLLDALRKKKLDKMAKLEPIFLAGVKQTSGFTDMQAEALWDRLNEFAKYAFNKAHSACYAIVAYQTAFLKANYPVEFMAALLSSIADSQDKISLYITECRKLNIEVLPPDVNSSYDGFTVDEGKIRFGLTAIKGVGGGAVEAIVHAREADGPFSDLFDLCCRIDAGACNRLAFEALIKSGAMDSLPGNRAQKLAVLDNAIEMGQSVARDRAAGQTNLFGDISASAQLTVPQLPSLDEYTPDLLLDMEREYLGLYISDHPINAHLAALTEYRTSSVEELAEIAAGEEMVIGGIITSVKPYTTKTGKLMGFITLDDLTGTIEITAFADTFEKYAKYLQPDAIVLIKGTVDLGLGRITTTSSEEDDDKPEPKLLAIAVAPIDNPGAITELQKASRARRNGNGNGNGNGYIRNQSAPAIAMPTYKPSFHRSQSEPPLPVEEAPPPPDYVEETMTEYTDTDAPAGAEGPVAQSCPACKLTLTEEFVKSDQFENLRSLLASSKGDSPVEITVQMENGSRRSWKAADISVNPANIIKILNILPGVSVEK